MIEYTKKAVKHTCSTTWQYAWPEPAVEHFIDGLYVYDPLAIGLDPLIQTVSGQLISQKRLCKNNTTINEHGHVHYSVRACMDSNSAVVIDALHAMLILYRILQCL
jgi:hypothetical protein